MWLLGAVVVFLGIGSLGWGAFARDDESGADDAIRRGAALVPLGLGLMFAAAPVTSTGGPRFFFAAYVVASALLGALVVARFSSDRDYGVVVGEEETPVAPPDAERAAERLRRIS